MPSNQSLLSLLLCPSSYLNPSIFLFTLKIVYEQKCTLSSICVTHCCVLEANWFIHHLLHHLPEELLISSNWNDNGVLYQHLHSLLTVCLSSQTWSFHQRLSLSTPMGPYTPQFLCPLRALALDLIQSSTAQALCCRMIQLPLIL